VTRKLESQINASRRTIIISDKGAALSEPPSSSGIKVVFVCRADIDPPILIEHLPRLVSTCNSSPKQANFVKLVPLPRGSELTLAAAMGLRRVAVFALDNSAPEISFFDSLLQSVPTLTAPWLVPAQKLPTKDLIPTHIKQIRTSAPKDMKTAKEQRAKGRAAAKKRTKGRSGSSSVRGSGGRRVIVTASQSTSR